MDAAINRLFEWFFQEHRLPRRLMAIMAILLMLPITIYSIEKLTGYFSYGELARRVAILKSLSDINPDVVSPNQELDRIYQEAIHELSRTSDHTLSIVEISKIIASATPGYSDSIVSDLLSFLGGALIWIIVAIVVMIQAYHSPGGITGSTAGAVLLSLLLAASAGMIFMYIPVLFNPWVNLFVGTIAQLFIIFSLAARGRKKIAISTD